MHMPDAGATHHGLLVILMSLKQFSEP